MLIAVALAAEPAPPRPAMFDTVCVACHTVGDGARVGPDLAGVGSRRTAADIDKWLQDPAAYKPGTVMPKLPMTDAERAELVTWLASLR